jgi:hypothetical protein
LLDYRTESIKLLEVEKHIMSTGFDNRIAAKKAKFNSMYGNEKPTSEMAIKGAISNI